MWDEDPKSAQGIYLLLVWSVVVSVVVGFFISLLSSDWHPYLVFLGVLGAILAALCIYAAVVWSMGYLSLKLWDMVKKLKNKHDAAS